MLARTLSLLAVTAAVVSGASIERRATTTVAAKFLVRRFGNPAYRGSDASTISTSPCGGITTGNFNDFPLVGGALSMEIDEEAYGLTLSYAEDFDSTEDPYTVFTDIWSMGNVKAGYRCMEAPDFSELGVLATQNITFRIAYTNKGGDARYQCADTTMVDYSSYISPGFFACSNETTASTSGLTALEAGWTGACVTLFVVLVALFAGYYTGLLSIGSLSFRRGGSHALRPKFGAGVKTPSNVELRGSADYPPGSVFNDGVSEHSVATTGSMRKQ
ncbi:hypothetical protein MNV49_002373 [Pseudohyphozyma bogoriensis]|nr:hypothetical protein MNV49_002373 [Pseudohyphozyma bogoriensis]